MNVQAAANAERKLVRLLDRYTEIRPDGFRIDLAGAHAQWDRCLKRIGLHRAYRRMAERLCRVYLERFGEPFLLTEDCVAWEIQYHVDAFMAARGYRHYSRNATTLLYSKAALISHCREVDISTEDIGDWKQRTMFRYRKGIRDCYRNTDRDPFHGGTFVPPPSEKNAESLNHF